MKALRILLSATAVVVAMVLIFNADSTDISPDRSTNTASATDASASTAKAIDEMPAVGDAAPGFTLLSNEGTTVSLADFRENWVVLYFYPRDFTRGCTIEAKKFEMDMAEYDARNAVVLGVSTDSAESHDDFCTKEGLSFKLLADEDGAVSDSYGSLNSGENGSLSARRNTFLINPEGIVSQVFLKVDPTPHSKQVLESLDALQTD
jgi:thioredoxin-dependent peroxiredoxin